MFFVCRELSKSLTFLQENVLFSISHLKACFVLTIVCMGAGLHAGAVEEQYDPSSRYPVNVIIPRHERCMSAEAHAQLFIPQACLKEQVDSLTPIALLKQMQPW